MTEPIPFANEEDAGYGVGRLLTLSDGVFAIALTLLVLSLHVDVTTPASELGGALREARPELYAYGLSVLVIGAFWTGHHRLYSHVVRVDAPLLWMNILYLGLVALIPYPTDLLGRYGHETDAVALYGAIVGLGALVGVGIAFYAEHESLVNRASASTAWARGLPIAVVFLASVPIALLSPKAAQFFWLLATAAHCEHHDGHHDPDPEPTGTRQRSEPRPNDVRHDAARCRPPLRMGGGDHGGGRPPGRGSPADRAARTGRAGGADPSRQPRLDDAAAAALVAARPSLRRRGNVSVTRRARRPPARADRVDVAASVALDFPDDIAVQRRVPYEARADSVMYRQVLAECAGTWLGGPPYDAKNVEGQAAAALPNGPRKCYGSAGQRWDRPGRRTIAWPSQRRSWRHTAVLRARSHRTLCCDRYPPPPRPAPGTSAGPWTRPAPGSRRRAPAGRWHASPSPTTSACARRRAP